MYRGSESKLVDKVEKYPGQVFKPVDELKDPNKGMLSTRMVEPVNAGVTDEAVMCTGMNVEQPLMGGKCDELEPELGKCGNLNKTAHRSVMYKVTCVLVYHFGNKC